MGAFVTNDQVGIYKNFEQRFHDEQISVVGATYEGYCFGEKQGNIIIIKTIVSEDMLFDVGLQSRHDDLDWELPENTMNLEESTRIILKLTYYTIYHHIDIEENI